MDEMTVKNRITEAVREPPAPEALIQRTILRAKAITAGRRAEEQLETGEKDLSGARRRELAATSLIGRLAAVADLPEGVRPEQMAARLAEEPRFVRAVESGNVLSRLKSGELLNAALQPPKRREAPAPEKSGPDRGGPQM